MENLDLNNIRLRTRREKIRLIKEDEEKLVRKLEKERRKLYDIKHKMPLIPLEKPYQKGFVRSFVLREDIAKGKNAEFFQGILDKINTYDYCDNRKFLKRKRKRGKKIYIPREQFLQKIPAVPQQSNKLGAEPLGFPEYKNMKFSEREQRYFVKTVEYNPHRKVWEVFWEFRDKWMFVLKVKPYMITHYKPVDCELESQIAQLDKYFDQHRIKGILRKKVYPHRNCWNLFQKKFIEKEKYKYNSLKNNNLCRMKISAMEISDYFEEIN